MTGGRILAVAAAVLLGAALSCGRSLGTDIDRLAVCEIADARTPREAGQPSPSVVGDCSDLPPDAPTFGCAWTDTCDSVILRCDPSEPNASETHTCCSDDPATIDGELPNLRGHTAPTSSDPLFAGAANGEGTSGVCVQTIGGELEGAPRAIDEPEARGCPLPCNPQWTDAQKLAICGEQSVCCQTVRLDPADCVFDELSNRWRAVKGTDIAVRTPSGGVITNWAPGAHATHQDPGGHRCVEVTGVANNDAWSAEYRACVQQLTVADERGFCLRPEQCCVTGDVVDVCERMN